MASPAMRKLVCEGSMKDLELLKRRLDITMEMVDKFLTKMYHTHSGFVLP